MASNVMTQHVASEVRMHVCICEDAAAEWWTLQLLCMGSVA